MYAQLLSLIWFIFVINVWQHSFTFDIYLKMNIIFTFVSRLSSHRFYWWLLLTSVFALKYFTDAPHKRPSETKPYSGERYIQLLHLKGWTHTWRTVQQYTETFLLSITSTISLLVVLVNCTPALTSLSLFWFLRALKHSKRSSVAKAFVILSMRSHSLVTPSNGSASYNPQSAPCTQINFINY